MRKSRWIKKHDEDILDAAYRELVGIRIWVLDYMKSVCNWETGIIDKWVDEEVAGDMGIPPTTLARHRRHLQEAGIITCKQGFQSQTIILHHYLPPIYTHPIPINPPPEGSRYAEIIADRMVTKSGNHKTKSGTPSLQQSGNPFYTDQTLKDFNTDHPQDLVFTMVRALLDATGLDFRLGDNYNKLLTCGLSLLDAEYSPEEIATIYGDRGTWYTNYWLGQKGQKPSLANITSTISNLKNPQAQASNGNTNGKSNGKGILTPTNTPPPAVDQEIVIEDSW